MAQKVDSQKLSQLAGQAVEITLRDGETLEQAEARVMQEHPDVFQQEEDLATAASVDNQPTANGDEDSNPSEMPEEIQAMFNNAVSSFPPGSIDLTRAMNQATQAYNAWKNQQPNQGKTSSLQNEADNKKYINDLVAANEADRVLSNVENLKKGVNTGPYAGAFFDSSVPKYDDKGNQEAPGFIDKAITSIFPGNTQKIRQLDAGLQGFSDYAFEKGGKQLTGTEKTSIFSRVPNRFDDDEQFDAVLNQSRGDLKAFVANKVKTLKGLGFPEEEILRLVSKELKGAQSEGQVPFVQRMLKTQVANPQAKDNTQQENIQKAAQEELKRRRGIQ